MKGAWDRLIPLSKQLQMQEADAVKFQTHLAASESTPSEPWRVKFSPQDAARFEYWKRMEFTEEGWSGLKEHADRRRLKFISSPFSVEAVDLMTRLGVAAWKVASGEVSNGPMFERMASTGHPVPHLHGHESPERDRRCSGTDQVERPAYDGTTVHLVLPPVRPTKSAST